MFFIQSARRARAEKDVARHIDASSVVWFILAPEAALLYVSTKNRDPWPCPTTEVRDSRTSRHSARALSQV